MNAVFPVSKREALERFLGHLVQLDQRGLATWAEKSAITRVKRELFELAEDYHV
jgi:hypothetical protein